VKRHIFRIIGLSLLLSVFIVSSVYAAKGKNPVREAQSDPSDTAQTQQTPKPGTMSKSPYAGAIVIEAKTGEVLFEDNADGKGSPASITKLMVLLVILEAIESKHLNLQDQVTITAEASRIGGSQVFLKEHEVFSVEDLLYATIVQSANDASTALALHYAGSKEAFVDLMNKRAKEIGMKDTVFHSVHGLPPGKNQLPDISTPRDLARLSQELLKHPETLQYTSTKERPFRADTQQPFMMRSHNHLLGALEGCDGLKTGYYRLAGFSIAATAEKKGVRAIAVVLGSSDRKVRDVKARELLSRGLMQLLAKKPPLGPAAIVQPIKSMQQAEEKVKPEVAEKTGDVVQIKKSTISLFVVIVSGILLLLIVIFFIKKRRSADKAIYLDNLPEA
jgi:serine-type D-Ala-D-Ala carboxypeptidase (penicillin-binding protein 5/6)